MARKSNKHIKGIYNSNGEWTSSTDDIGAILLSHFKNIFLADSSVPLHWPSFYQQSFLIDLAISSMAPTWARWVPAGFYQKFWEILKMDVYQLISLWTSNQTSLEHYNKTILTLIPKCNNFCFPFDWRPISLYNTTHKILSKLISSVLGFNKFFHQSLVLPRSLHEGSWQPDA